MRLQAPLIYYTFFRLGLFIIFTKMHRISILLFFFLFFKIFLVKLFISELDYKKKALSKYSKIIFLWIIEFIVDVLYFETFLFLFVFLFYFADFDTQQMCRKHFSTADFFVYLICWFWCDKHFVPLVTFFQSTLIVNNLIVIIHSACFNLKNGDIYVF